MTEDVQFPLHHSLHHVDVCVRSFYDVLGLFVNL